MAGDRGTKEEEIRLDLGLDVFHKFILEGGERDLNDALVITTLYKTILGQLISFIDANCNANIVQFRKCVRVGFSQHGSCKIRKMLAAHEVIKFQLTMKYYAFRKPN